MCVCVRARVCIYMHVPMYMNVYAFAFIFLVYVLFFSLLLSYLKYDFCNNSNSIFIYIIYSAQIENVCLKPIVNLFAIANKSFFNSKCQEFLSSPATAETKQTHTHTLTHARTNTETDSHNVTALVLDN